MTEPFSQRPFELLPEAPSRPHRWLDLPEERIAVWTEATGTTEASVRVAGQGPPLLALHGLMTTGYSWRYAYEELAKHFTVWMPDLVGAGRSTKPDCAYTPEVVADWVVAFSEAAGLHGASVLGNSMGGYLGMWAVLRHPRAFRRLLVLHAPGPPTARMWALWAAMRMPGSRSLLAHLVGADPLRWAHRHVHYWDEGLKSLEEAREYGQPLAQPDGLRAFAHYLRDTMDARSQLRLVRALRARRNEGCSFPVPVRLVYARRDPVVPPEAGRVLSELIPEADLVWLSEASHFAHVDAVDRFLDQAVPWLTADTALAAV